MIDNGLELSLVETMRKADLSELSADVTDKALEAAGGIPIMGTLYKLWKAASSIPTYLFAKKVFRFLYELKDIPPEERQAQLARLDVVPGETEKIGETVLLLLDRLNDMQKPTMLGRAFRAYLEKKITLEQFHALSHAIDALSVSHLAEVERLYNKDTVSFGDPYHTIGPSVWRTSIYGEDDLDRNLPMQSLAMCGLVSLDWVAEEAIATEHRKTIRGRIVYVPNKLGQLFRDFVLTPPTGPRTSRTP
jgi:hypothetical protein